MTPCSAALSGSPAAGLSVLISQASWRLRSSLIARERYHLGGEKETSTMALDKIISLKYTTSMARCKGCNNHCVLTVNQFGSSRRYISGNRCERGLGIEKAKKEIPNLFDYKYRRMFDYEPFPWMRQTGAA